jgi:hypothetical protein
VTGQEFGFGMFFAGVIVATLSSVVHEFLSWQRGRP